MRRFKLALRYSLNDEESAPKYKYVCSYEYKSVFEEAIMLLVLFDSPHQYIIIKKNTVHINTGCDTINKGGFINFTNRTEIKYNRKNHFSR